MFRSRKRLKWGIGAGATLTIALLFHVVKQSDTFLQAVAFNQDRVQSQAVQMYDGKPATSLEKTPQARTHAFTPERLNHNRQISKSFDRKSKKEECHEDKKDEQDHDEDDWYGEDIESTNLSHANMSFLIYSHR